MERIRSFFTRAPGAAAAVVLSAALALGSVTQYFIDCREVRGDVLRLHVIAASDSDADQAVKLLVRDAVLAEGATVFDGSVTADEAQQRLFTEKDRYDQEMLDLEKSIPGSYGLAAQECVQCKKCARLSGHPCVHPDKMRYSLEAVGCFPVELVHDKFGFDILWSDGESIPEYYLLVAGVLLK